MSSRPEGRDETARLELQEARVKLAMVLIQLAVLGWFLIPPHTRKLAGMRLAAASRRHLTWLARRAGHTSMGIELATGADRQYRLPYLLSQMRDKAQAAYDRAREA